MRDPMPRLKPVDGFSLLELLVAMAITLIVIGGALTGMQSALRMNEAATLMSRMNGHLRSGIDMMMRDFAQIAQGLPNNRRISVPFGGGATPLIHPTPTVLGLAFPNQPSLGAVTTHPGGGGAVNGQPTDVITILFADTSFGRVVIDPEDIELSPASITLPAGIALNNGVGPEMRAGDLVMVTRADRTTLLYVSNVAGQELQFATDVDNDPLNLNQFSDASGMDGTLNRIDSATGTVELSKIRMVTYYVDATRNPVRPMLMRRVNMRPPMAVAFDVQNLDLTYDISDNDDTWIRIPLSAADRGAGGPCEGPCSENNIHKVNIMLAGRSSQPYSVTKQFLTNTLFSQISLRNLSFVDEYPAPVEGEEP